MICFVFFKHTDMPLKITQYFTSRLDEEKQTGWVNGWPDFNFGQVKSNINYMVILLLLLRMFSTLFHNSSAWRLWEVIMSLKRLSALMAAQRPKQSTLTVVSFKENKWVCSQYHSDHFVSTILHTHMHIIYSLCSMSIFILILIPVCYAILQLGIFY